MSWTARMWEAILVIRRSNAPMHCDGLGWRLQLALEYLMERGRGLPRDWAIYGKANR